MKFRCGCGAYNYTREDWLCHFRYGGFWRGMKNFFLTRIEFN